MILKLEKLRESEAWSPSFVAQKYRLTDKNCHIFVQFPVHPIKFDITLLMVTFFKIIQVFIFKKICLLMLIKMKKALKDLATAYFTKT